MANKKRISALKLFVVITLSILLLGCGGDKSDKTKQQKTKIIVAKERSIVTPLYFNGLLEPIRTIPVISPVDGRIAELKFEYGQSVVKKQELVSLDSVQLAENYRKAVSGYLQKKQAYTNGIAIYRGEVALYKAKVTSRNSFLTAQSTYENSVLDFYQARYDLEKVLRKVNIDPKSIERLTLADTQTISKILQRKFSHIVIDSPGTGVALFPINDQSSSGNGGDKSGKLVVGSQIKTGQLMLSIGDLGGLSVKIEVSEVNINRIKAGMKVTITGDAFPGINLHGKVTSVSSQANPSTGGSNTSMFNVVIQVAEITNKQRDIIHVGMTAKVQIDIKEKSRILLPIKAIFQTNGKSMVTIVDQSGQRKNISVITGETTPQGLVTIISGVKAGDKVVVND